MYHNAYQSIHHCLSVSCPSSIEVYVIKCTQVPFYKFVSYYRIAAARDLQQYACLQWSLSGPEEYLLQ